MRKAPISFISPLRCHIRHNVPVHWNGRHASMLDNAATLRRWKDKETARVVIMAARIIRLERAGRIGTR